MITVNLQFASAQDANDFMVLVEAGAKQLGFQTFKLADQVIRSTLNTINTNVERESEAVQA